MVSVALSYLLLMLLFTLDFGIFSAVTLGYGFGYAFFGFSRRRSYLSIYNPKGDKSQLEIES